MTQLAETSVRKSTVFMLVEQVVALAAGFGVSLLLTRSLTTADYGLVKTFQALSVPVFYVLTLGFERVLMRYVPELRARNGARPALQLLGLLVILRVAVCFVFIVGAVLVRQSLGGWLNAPELFDRYLGLTLAFTGLTLVTPVFGRGWYTALARRDTVSYAIIARRLTLVVILVVVVWRGAQIQLVLTAIVSAAAVEGAIYIWHLPHVLRALWREATTRAQARLVDLRRRMFRFAAFVSGWQSLQLFRETSIDTLVVVSLIGPEAAAFYHIASVMPNLLRTFSPAKLLSGILLPKVVRRMTADGGVDRLEQSFVFFTKLNLIFWLPASCLLALNIGPLLTTIYGEAYASSATAAVLLTGSLLLTTLTDPYYYATEVLDQTQVHFYSAFWGALNLGLDILLVPVMGITGAALATLAVSVILLAHFHIALNRLQPGRFVLEGRIVRRGLLGAVLVVTVDSLLLYAMPSAIGMVGGGLAAAVTFGVYVRRWHCFDARELGYFRQMPIVRRLLKPDANEFLDSV